MPRLVGKKGNSALYVGVILVAAALGLVAVEYFGVVDYVPNFGKPSALNSNSTNQPTQVNTTIQQ